MPNYQKLSQVKENSSDLKKLYQLAIKELELNKLTIRQYQEVLHEVETLLDMSVDRNTIKKVIENGKERAILDVIIHNQSCTK